jgi:hypothetical protein
LIGGDGGAVFIGVFELIVFIISALISAIKYPPFNIMIVLYLVAGFNILIVLVIAMAYMFTPLKI